MKLRNRILVSLLAGGVLALFPAWLPSGALFKTPHAVAQELAPVDAPPVTGEYVPQGVTAVITLHPQAFFSQRSLRLMPLEMIRVSGQQQVGIDPLKIEQIKVVIGEIGAMGPTFGAVVQMADPVELEKFNPQVVRIDQPMTIDDKDYYPVDGPPGAVLHLVDPRTALVGMQPFLERMLAASGDEPPLAPLLEELETSDHAMAMLAIEPIRPMLQAALDQQLQIAGPVLPPSVQALRELPTLTDHVRLRAQVGDDFLAQLTLTAVDDAAAEQLENLLIAAMADIRTALVQQMQQGGFPDPEMAAAMRDYAQRMSGEIVKSLTPVRDGRRVAITVREDVPHVAMLSMISGISFPAMVRARGAARRMQSSNNLKQLGLAMHNYHDTYQGFPDPAIRDEDGEPLLSWRVAVLPFVEGQELYEQFHLDEPWDSEHNLTLLEKMPDVYKHPSSATEAGHTVYQAIVGEDIGLKPEGQTRFQHILDGTSNTIMMAEIEDEFAVPWTKPEDVAIAPDDPWPPLGGHNTEGANMLFFDGSVRLIPYWLEPEKLWHMMTRAGGEVIERF